jgi:hypothetical protein
MIIPVILLCVADIVFWFKGNARDLYALEWSPFKWWIYTSLFTNYLTLFAWWQLVERFDVWRAGVVCSICGLVVTLILNTYFYGINWRGTLALCLCVLSIVIVKI